MMLYFSTAGTSVARAQPMDSETLSFINAIAQAVMALFTVILAALAIWGDQIKARISGPQLAVTLRDTKGNLTASQGGTKLIYYHLQVRNKLGRQPAEAVRVLLTSLARRLPDGQFADLALAVPVQFTWCFPGTRDSTPTVFNEDFCDFGRVAEGGQSFELALYIYPMNFQGKVRPGETLRVGVRVEARNSSSRQPAFFDVTWDGHWTTDMDVMSQHLRITPVR
jgi:hypothetical protein